MANVRMSRIDAEIQKHVATIINNKLEHPDIKGAFITVVKASTTADLSISTIYITVYGSDNKKVLDALVASKNFIRRELGNEMRLRVVPDLRFMLDTSYEYGKHMDSLFDSIK